MIILGIDTSGYVNAVGVVDGTRVLADKNFPARTDTLEQIVDNIDVTLKSAGLSLKDVEGIGVGLGPGSWTGIKVGVTVGKMLAFSLNKPVAGIPTLDALAYAVRRETRPVYTVIGAGVKDMVYAARYIYQGDEPVRQGDYFAGDIRGLADMIKEPVVLAGQEALRYQKILIGKSEPVGDRTRPKNGDSLEKALHNTNSITNNEPAQTGKLHLNIHALENEPAGASVAALAAIRLARGQADNPLSLTPLYLKESTAKVFVNRYAIKDKQ